MNVEGLDEKLKARARERLRQEVKAALEPLRVFIIQQGVYHSECDLRCIQDKSTGVSVPVVIGNALEMIKAKLFNNPEIVRKYENEEIELFLASVHQFSQQVEYLQRVVETREE